MKPSSPCPFCEQCVMLPIVPYPDCAECVAWEMSQENLTPGDAQGLPAGLGRTKAMASPAGSKRNESARGGGVERQRHGRCRGETPLLSLIGGMTYMPCVKSIPPRGEVNLEGGE